MDEKSNYKMCPLLTVNSLVVKEGQASIGVTPAPCVNDKCAWWNEDRQKCSMAVVPPRK